MFAAWLLEAPSFSFLFKILTAWAADSIGINFTKTLGQGLHLFMLGQRYETFLLCLLARPQRVEKLVFKLGEEG